MSSTAEDLVDSFVKATIFFMLPLLLYAKSAMTQQEMGLRMVVGQSMWLRLKECSGPSQKPAFPRGCCARQGAELAFSSWL